MAGYCMGGTNALRVIAAFPERVQGAACFHAGNLATNASDSPHLLVGNITGEVYFGHADNDQSMTPPQIATLEEALDDPGCCSCCDTCRTALRLPDFDVVGLQSFLDGLEEGLATGGAVTAAA